MTEEIMLEMNWRTAVPMLVEIIANAETPKARMDARDELLRCARIADQAVRLEPAARAVADELNLWGDDTLERFNLMKVLSDLNAVLPTAKVDAASPSPEPTDA
jgi:hypothetical protein